MSSGLGRVYLPEYTDRRTGQKKKQNVYWADYTISGKRIRESTRCTTRKAAAKFLHDRLAERGRGIRRRDVEKTTFADLERLIRADYEKRKRRSTERLVTSLKRLRPAFGDWCAIDITSAAWSSYQTERLEEGASNASVNRERSALVRMFALGKKHQLVLDVPDLDRLPENNVRDVDVTPKQFATLLEHLPKHLRPVAVFGYITGWRKREILSRTWADVDWDAGWVYLDRSTAKNNQPKAFPLGVVPWLDDTLREQERRKLEVEKANGRIVPDVFFYRSGERAGESFADFRKSWATACKAAGLPGLRFHDLRRSAAVQMLEAGIPEVHAQRFMGHRTRSIFDRYAITNRTVLRSQARKLGEHYGDGAPKPDRKVTSISRQGSGKVAAG